jgi:lysine 6-dehydrogenase
MLNQKQILVLGAGLVGRPMALDLAQGQEFEVTIADINQDALERIKAEAPVHIVCSDVSDPGEVKKLAGPFDIVLDAVPGFLGYQTFKSLIECGKNVVDIAFFPEDPFDLDGLAKDRGVTAIMDMGVAPGMSNVLTAFAHHQLDTTSSAVTYVGGLPRVRTKPYEYKAGFSPIDVIEEYTRPARFVRDGKLITLPALSEPEMMEFPGIGTLEAFNSDGLRSLYKTIEAPNLIEKTLRYPGHIQLMQVLRDSGFFNKEPVEIDGVSVSPLAVSASLLFPLWKLKEGEEDLTVMKIMIEGHKNNKKIRYTYDLLDYYDTATKIHSMARTTGYTATAAVRMMARGLFTQKGVIVPEFIGRDTTCVRFLLEELEKRGVVYSEEITLLD